MDDPTLHDHRERWDASDQRALLHLRNVERMPHRVIAYHLGRTIAAVRSKLYRLHKETPVD